MNQHNPGSMMLVHAPLSFVFLACYTVLFLVFARPLLMYTPIIGAEAWHGLAFSLLPKEISKPHLLADLGSIYYDRF